ncbi:MAG: hypothetical protein E7625_03055 [Ruminococcaceae bacterium]|nr:hypothetical protein [Oscillospiraceae bacterium]
MKKFLAALLAVLMVLSTCATIVVSVAAEDAGSNEKAEEHRITMSDADATIDGWLSGTANAVLPKVNADSKGCIAWVFAPGKINAAHLSARFTAEKTDTTSYDITKYTHCVFDFYVSDADLLNKDNAAGVQFCFELTSSGTYDQEETGATFFIDAWLEGDLQDGWNQIKVPLDALTSSVTDPFDPTRWNFVRMFNNVELVVSEGLTVAIDNFGFANDTESVIVTNCDPDLNGWTGTANDIKVDKLTGVDKETGKDVYEPQNAMGMVLPTGEKPVGAIQLTWIAPDEEAVIDISNMKYIEFDLYVSDDKVLPNARNIWIELGSAGKCDHNEFSVEFWNNQNPSLGLKKGWNHIQLSLELFKNNGSNGDLDMTKLNYFRFFTNTKFTLTEEFTIAIDNVTFWDGTDALEMDKAGVALAQGREIITFAPNTEAQKPYEYKRDEWKYENRNPLDQYRTSNADGVVMYQFPIEYAKTAQKVFFSAKMGGQMLLSVSTDGEHWNEVYKFEDAKAAADNSCSNNRYASMHTFDLTEYVVDEDGGLLGEAVYIKLQDAYPNSGWGGQIHFNANVTLEVIYDIPGFEANDAYSFTVGKENEKTYLVSEGTGLTETLRFADKNDAVIYKYNLERTEHLDRVSWGASVQGQYVISVSTDGTNWTEISRWVTGDSMDASSKLLDLSAGIDMSGKVEAIWVKISDAITTDGNGGAVNNTRPVTLQVTYYNAEAIVHNDISFSINTEDENNYLLDEGGSKLKNDNGAITKRYADKEAYYVYAYDLKEFDSIRGLTWKVKIEAWYHVWASADGENWVEIAKATKAESAAVVPFDLSSVLADVAKTKKLFVKVGDAVITDGYGGAVYTDTPVILDVANIPLTDAELDALEMTGDEHSRPLWGCNENWPHDGEENGWVLDMENQLSGSGCISLDITDGFNSHYNSGGAIYPMPVNGTGMDTLEFDVYLSHVEIATSLPNAGMSQIELTSSGGMDVEEWSFNWQQMFDYIVGEVKVGWNHVAIPMDKAYQQDDTFRITNINWLRLYRVPAKKGLIPEGWVMKFDNFRLTDAIQYAKDEAKREQQAMIDKHAALIEEIKTLDIYKTSTSITEENYAEAKAAIEAMREKVNALPEVELQVLTDAKAIRPLTNAENTLKGYEEDVEEEKKALEENKDFLAEIDKLAADYATITADNLEAATAAAVAVREKYEALKKSVRNLLERKGYLAKLEAVEAAIEDFKPSDGPTVPGDPEPNEGCNSALTIGAGAMMLMAAAWVTIAARKKED